MNDAIVLEMRRRIRRHMLTSFAGAFIGITIMGIGSGVVTAIAGSPPAAWIGAAYGVVGLLAIASIPAIGFYSTFTNLRCPQCNGLAAWQVSMKYSAFGAFASNECNKCGTTIFAPAGSRRFLILIAMIAVGFFLAAMGLAGFAASSHRRAPDAQPPASSAP